MYVKIEGNITAYKSFSIEICNSKGLLSVDVEDFRLAKLAKIYSTRWIEIFYISKLPSSISYQNRNLIEQIWMWNH